MGSESDRRDLDPLKQAALAFEEHERELFEELLSQAQKGIPEGATVGEAIAEMQRAALEDDSVQELLLRVATIQFQNRGFIRSKFESYERDAPEVEGVYKATLPGRSFSREEIDLLEQLWGEIDRRLPPGLTEEEREARIAELLSEDEKLAALAQHLEKLAAEDGGSPIFYLNINNPPARND